ncbi:hypothetical protein [Hydrogenophaga atypica]|uniref:Uncharacterized protein n=1 Tax=Hydrogenophaga atypica TaxID=249409 RepID=A0ABW2QLN7_9BURK
MQMQSLQRQGLVGTLALVIASGAFAQTKLVDGGTQVQVGRYTTQAARPAPGLQEPLEVYAQLRFPRSTVRSVGDAIQHTLMRTGYQLLSTDLLSEEARHFLTLPLPESQRELGPFEVKEILQVILGKAWRLQQDPVKRLVWFELAAGTGSTGAHVNSATEAASASPSAPAPSSTPNPALEQRSDSTSGLYMN